MSMLCACICTYMPTHTTALRSEWKPGLGKATVAILGTPYRVVTGLIIYVQIVCTYCMKIQQVKNLWIKVLEVSRLKVVTLQ